MPYTKYVILLADDDADDCLLFKEALEDISVTQPPIILHDGTELIKYLEEAVVLPDILFLDINMPLMDGITALRTIKAQKNRQEFPIVMFSTTKDPATVQVSWQCGANLYACKPNGYSSLVALLEKILALDVTGLLHNRQRERFLMQVD